jgi:hypothetical protein
MLLINFSHPLDDTDRSRIEELTGGKVEVKNITTHFENEVPFTEQSQALMNSIDIHPYGWEGGNILINPPGQSVIAATLIAHMHGLMGHFPRILRMKPTTKANYKKRFEVAEIIDLLEVRDDARQLRDT